MGGGGVRVRVGVGGGVRVVNMFGFMVIRVNKG